MDKAASLVADLLAFIAMDDCTDDQFNQLALRLFAYQYECNAPFRSFCQRRGASLRNVKSWRDIPAVPIDAFKAMELRSEPASPAERVFMTSGTTGRAARGRHFHPALEVYDLSMKRYFSQRFMQGVQRMEMGVLFPDEQAMPNSSLAHYLALAKTEFGTPDSRYFLTPEGLDMPGLCAALQASEQSGKPFALLGASFSLVHVMDALREMGRSFHLPAGSRILDTGGYKGQSRELPLEAFYAELSQLLGVPRSLCINMYGMTELSSQIYDQNILSYYTDGSSNYLKATPSWVRSVFLDPASLTPVADGEQGVIAHYDLANWNSCLAILTEDLGVRTDSGYELNGRAKGAEARGCSIAVDEVMAANA